MKRLTLRILAAAIATLAAAGAQAHDNPTVWNTAQVPAAVTVNYALCKTDTFTVPARNIQGPGKATAPSSRGACLITKVSATLQGRPHRVTAFSSSGSIYSVFLIRFMGGDPAYKIYPDKDMSPSHFETEKFKDDSPDGPLASMATSRMTGTLAGCQQDNQASIRQLEARIAGAPGGKLTKTQKDHYTSIRTSLKPVPGQKGTLDNCHKKTATIVAWKTEVDQALGTTM